MTTPDPATCEDDPMSTVSVEDIRYIERPESVELARTETARMVTLLRSLGEQDWTRPTDCTAWDVRAVAGHVLGMTETFSALPRFARSMSGAARAAGDGPFIDALTARQVLANAHLSRTELVDRMEAAGPVQARWRGSRRLMRRIPMKNDLRDGTVETWQMAFIFDTILTRDTWMHRIDIATAIGHPMELTAEHDGRIVADVVAEWARRHGQSFTLHLEGPAGGRYARGRDGDDMTLDAVEFCRTLAGRQKGTRLLAQEVPF